MRIMRACAGVGLALLLVASLARPAHADAVAAAHWNELGMPMRSGAPLLWDAAEQRFVVFAWLGDEAARLPDPWEYRDGQGWRALALPPPPFASATYIVPDDAHRRFLVAVPAANRTMELWALDLGSPLAWTRFSAGGTVPMVALTIDPVTDQIFAFPAGATRGLWARSLADTGSWRLLRTLPGTRAYIPSVVDGRRERLVQFDGSGLGTDSLFAWTLPLTGAAGWSREVAGPSVPNYRAGSRVVLDTLRQRVLLYGGSSPAFAEGVDGTIRYDDCLAYDLQAPGTWSTLGKDALPVVSGSSFGLRDDRLYGFTPLSTTPPGGPGLFSTPLSDPADLRTEWLPDWPAEGRFTFFVPDSARGGWLAGGGDADTLWALRVRDGEPTWTRVLATGEPPPLDRSTLGLSAFDECTGTVWVQSADTTTGNPWALHLGAAPRWERVQVAGASPSGVGALVFDPVERRLVALAEYCEQAWTLAVDSAATWRVVALGSPGPGMHFHHGTVTYDPIRDGVIVHRRGVDAGFQVLALRPSPHWTSGVILDCPGLCPDIVGDVTEQGVFDPVGRRVIEVGYGYAAGYETPTIPSAATMPVYRALAMTGLRYLYNFTPLAYAAELHGVLAYGQGSLPALHLLALPPDSTPVAHALPPVALADRIALRWQAVPLASFVLSRRDGARDWAPLATLASTASGAIAYDDRAIDGGAHYGYRLASAAAPDVPIAADTWVLAPSAGAALALARPWPMPASGGVNVAFTLPVGAPATLELFDVAGRRVWSRRLDGLAPGPHFVRLQLPGEGRAGFYVLRLAQGGHARTRPIVWVR